MDCSVELMDETLILVDERDREIGSEAKMVIHRKGMLHRAFSIFIFDEKGRFLLQKRASDKYHSGGLWSNSCCGHPRVGEDLFSAAARRLYEEMGMACPLSKRSEFVYRADVTDELTEYEYDHVLVGTHSADPSPNPEEASAWMWIEPERLAMWLTRAPDEFTAWFKLLMSKNLNFTFAGEAAPNV